MLKKVIYLIVGLLFISALSVGAVTVYQGWQGGTGIGTATTTDVGKYLRVSSSSPWLTYEFATVSGGTATPTINGTDGPAFTFVTGTTGTDFGIASSTGTITFNLPTASASNRGVLASSSFTDFTTAYNDRLKWDGGATGLNSTTGRNSLGLGTMALEANTGSTTITTLGTITTGTWNGGNVSTTNATTTNLITTNTTSTNLVLTNPLLATSGGTGTTTALGTMAFQNANAVAITGGNAIFTTSTSTNVYVTSATSTYLATDATGKIIATSTPASSSYWTSVSGTIARVSNTSFTSAGSDLTNLLQKGTIVKWTESSAVKQAMIQTGTFSTPTSTFTLVGDTMASIDTGSLKYGFEKARKFNFAIAGTIGATSTNSANTVMEEMPAKILGASLWTGTAGNGTTTIDIKKNGTSVFTTKPYINGTNQIGVGFTADSGTSGTSNDLWTMDIITTAATTAVIDLYANLFWTPLNNYLYQ